MSTVPRSLDFNAAEHPTSFARRTSAHGRFVIGDDADIKVTRLPNGGFSIFVDGNGTDGTIEASQDAALLIAGGIVRAGDHGETNRMAPTVEWGYRDEWGNVVATNATERAVREVVDSIPELTVVRRVVVVTEWVTA